MAFTSESRLVIFSASFRTVVTLRAVVGRLKARPNMAGVIVESLKLPRVRQ